MEKENFAVVTHSYFDKYCLDGLFAGLITKYNLTKTFSNAKVDIFEYVHSLKFNLDVLLGAEKFDAVIFTDCSPKEEEYDVLIDYGFKVLVMDHHKNNTKFIPDEYKVIDYTMSGTKIAYSNKVYYHNGDLKLVKSNLEKNYLVEALSAYDTWTFTEGDDYHMIALSLMSLKNTLPELANKMVDNLHFYESFDYCRVLVDKGRKIFQLQQMEIIEDSRNAEYFIMRINNTDVFCSILPASRNISALGNYLIKNKLVNLSIMYFIDSMGIVNYSLRGANNTDYALQLARAMGGGGHNQAAGFSSNRVIPIEEFSSLRI